ncbi:hypothetical protein BC628DRAFT_820337 [Trametes gibbosa]|nr:hypothetical protein BC628DRAFT_820337 [Trametes gibbosa]
MLSLLNYQASHSSRVFACTTVNAFERTWKHFSAPRSGHILSSDAVDLIHAFVFQSALLDFASLTLTTTVRKSPLKLTLRYERVLCRQKSGLDLPSRRVILSAMHPTLRAHNAPETPDPTEAVYLSAVLSWQINPSVGSRCTWRLAITCHRIPGLTPADGLFRNLRVRARARVCQVCLNVHRLCAPRSFYDS